MCHIPLNLSERIPSYMEDVGYELREFSVLSNIDGQFHSKGWLCDINNDGFDEVIAVYDYDTQIDPTLRFTIMGYDSDKQTFVEYISIETEILDMEYGPEPVQYIEYQGIYGFKCLVDISKYPLEVKTQKLENKNLAWCFFSWNKELKNYTAADFMAE